MSLAENLISGITIQSVTPELWITHNAQCLQFIETEKNWKAIPLFNYVVPDKIKNEQLVRFRGMIKNMYNSEIFWSKYEVQNTVTGVTTVCSGKLKDTVVCKENEIFVEDSKHNENGERDTWLCVPIPALNDWVSASWKKPYMKRLCNSEEEDAEPPKRMLSEVQQLPSSSLGSSELNLPKPHNKTCYMKLYDFDTTAYVLNDVIEVAGFVSFCNVSEEEFGMEYTLDTKVPVVHVVASKNLSQNSSLLSDLSLDIASGDMRSVRNDLHLVFTQLLLGDTLAADYLLCHLLSSVYSRIGTMALGQLPLNIINIPQNNYVKNIYKIIELLVVKSVFLSLSLENLNRRPFNPKKDYEKDQLSEGLLQLSPHTHLVLDETQLQPGKLDTFGVLNMTALRKLVLEQEVAYDFEYYQLNFNCDIPVLVLSEGKSLIPCTVVVPLKFDEECLDIIPEIFQAAHRFLEPSLLHRIRAYILSAQAASFTINSEMQKVIQKDFVQLRQNKGINTSADDLHNLFVLARLMGLSVGESALSDETWQHTLDLEVQRKERLLSINQS